MRAASAAPGARARAARGAQAAARAPRSTRSPSLAHASEAGLHAARVLVLGGGFLGARVAAALPTGTAYATVLSPSERADAERAGAPPESLVGFADAAELLAEGEYTHVLSTIPPDASGRDAGLEATQCMLACGHAAACVRWVGYCSSTSVYGGAGGRLVDECSVPAPASERGEKRLAAERAWVAAFPEENLPESADVGRTQVPCLRVFRLGALYGPGRSALSALQRMHADGGSNAAAQRRSAAPRTPRIHVDDAVAAIIASMAQAGTAASTRVAIYNLVDDDDSPRADALRFAAELAGMPSLVEADRGSDANGFSCGSAKDAADVGPTVRDAEKDKRVSNTRMKADLGVALRYPTFREGLRAIAKVEVGSAGTPSTGVASAAGTSSA